MMAASARHVYNEGPKNEVVLLRCSHCEPASGEVRRVAKYSTEPSFGNGVPHGGCGVHARLQQSRIMFELKGIMRLGRRTIRRMSSKVRKQWFVNLLLVEI